MKIKNILKYLPFYAFSVLPFPVLYVVSDIFFFLVFYVFKYRRSVVQENIKNSFPEKKEEERRVIEKKFYKHLCDVVVETLKHLTLSKKSLRKRFLPLKDKVFDEYLKKKKNIILYTAHLGNWEWLASLSFDKKYKTFTFYQKLSSKYFNELMSLSRERFSVQAVESARGYRALATQKKEGVPIAVCMIGDQCPHEQSEKYWLDFLHQDTPFFVGVDKIAKKIEFSVFSLFVKKLRRGYYKPEVRFISDGVIYKDNYTIVEKYALFLEEAIQSQPHTWLWTHKRWKRKRKITPKDTALKVQ